MNNTEKKEEITGKNRIVKNILTSWLGQMIYIVSGFIMPRLLSDELGQDALGVWDIAWSLISYFGILQGGVGASVNRYVAKYRAQERHEEINKVASSAALVQVSAGLLVLLLTAITAWLLPNLLGSQLGELTEDARFVVLFIGAGLAVQMFFNVFVGIITGFHRWDIHNGITAGIYTLTVIAMITTLLLGGGLVALALVNFLGTLTTELVRMYIGFRIAPGLRIRPKYVRLEVIKKQLSFGGKMLMPSISNLLATHTSNVLIVLYLGPAMLALFARPRSLINHINTLLKKMAFILTPITSSIQATSDIDELRDFYIKISRSSYYVALPMILGFAILGEEVLRLWMGPDYANITLPLILSLGYFFTVAHSPSFSVLMGLNAHGRAGVGTLVAAMFVVVLVFLSLEFTGLGLTGVALGLVIPMVLLNGIYVPSLICRKLEITLPYFYRQVAIVPLLAITPFATTLILIKIYSPMGPTPTLLVGAIAGAATLAVPYWKYALPDRMKKKITKRVPWLLKH